MEQTMVIEVLEPKDILPLMRYRTIFYDVPKNCPEDVLLQVMRERGINIIGVKQNGKLVYASWTFKDEDIKRYVPLAKEIGVWHGTKDNVDELWRKTIDIFMSDNTRELFGFMLSINRGQAAQVIKMGGKVYKDIGRIKCADGIERDLSLNVLTRAGYYGLKYEDSYSLDTYKLLLRS